MSCTLLVASTGGHLTQLHRLVPRLTGIPHDRLWVTFDTPQSRSLLGDESVRFVRYTRSRDWRSVAVNMAEATRLITRHDVGAVVSTGSGIALSFLPIASALGRRAIYLESAARTSGPSVTGRLLRMVPGVQLHTQYRAWADRRWRFAGSVFDEYEPGLATTPPRARLKVVVSLGTITFGFRRLVQRLLDVLPSNADVVWQTGVTPVDDLRIPARTSVPAEELREAVQEADVVVSHAGVGTALDALAAGQHPILVPREAAHGEHVDDHQRLLCSELEGRGVATSRTVDELTTDDVLSAARLRTVRTRRPAPIVLDQDAAAPLEPPLPAREWSGVPQPVAHSLRRW